jgi:hypothetical protein
VGERWWLAFHGNETIHIASLPVSKNSASSCTTESYGNHQDAAEQTHGLPSATHNFERILRNVLIVGEQRIHKVGKKSRIRVAPEEITLSNSSAQGDVIAGREAPLTRTRERRVAKL